MKIKGAKSKKVFETDYSEVIVTLRYGEMEILSRGTLLESPKARFAAALIERWGMVAAIPDGEDSSGRQQLRLLTVPELIKRAVETADELFDALDNLDWVRNAPSWEECQEVAAKIEHEQRELDRHDSP